MASILEAFLAGKEARRVADAQEQINAMQQFVGQNGQAIMAGDQNALGQLAGFGVQGLQTAMGIQDNLDVRQDRAYNRDRAKVEDGRADERWRLEVEEYKKGLTAEQAAQEAAVYENAAKMALTATSPEQWDKLATENGAPELVGQFENRQAVAARFMTTAEVLKATEGPEPAEWRPATPEEAAAYGATAGQISSKTGEFKRTPVDSTMMLETLPNGTTRFTQGPGAGAEGNKMKPSDPNAMIASIDGILNDPALPYSTGALSLLQHIPGTPMKRFQGRAKQLEGQAFLQAFESLKGAGQITEIEGQKATDAIGRLDTAQDAKDYAQALIELREVLELAASRPQGWAATQEAAGGTGGAGAGDPVVIGGDAEYDALPSGAIFVGPDGVKRRKP